MLRHIISTLTIAIGLVFTAATISPSLAQRTEEPSGEWAVLAEQPLEFDNTRVTIDIGERQGRFRRLRLEAVRGDIVVNSLRVTFTRGDVDDIPLRQEIQQGRRTGALELAGGRPRRIEKVEIDYRARRGFRGRAVLRLTGERGTLDFDRQPDRPVADQYQELDIQRVDLRSDRFVMPVGRGEGRVSAIKLRVLDNPVFVRRLEILYGNGRSQEVRIGEVLEPGRETRVIDLEGDLRFIREVVVTTRPQNIRREARLQLLGDIGSDTRPPERPSLPPPPVAEPIEPGLRERLRPPPATDVNGIPRGHVLFGAQRAGFTTERDVIQVGRQVGLFDKVVMRVVDNAIFLREFTIVYENGERDRIPVGQEIRANSLTPTLLLQGDRFIREIEFLYQSRPSGRVEAVVEVYGEYAESWLGDQGRGRGRDYNEGWVLIGAQRAQMVNRDADTFDVGRRFGPVRAFRITAKRHAVEISGVRVIYANGESEMLPARFDLRDGQSSPTLDLSGRGRLVDQVIVTARTKLNLRGEGVVELWGQN